MSAPIVFIDGDQGTTGLQIRERLHDRTDITLLTLTGDDRKDARRRAQAINACDIAVLCLPDAAAREVVQAIPRSGSSTLARRTGYSPAGHTAFPK